MTIGGVATRIFFNFLGTLSLLSEEEESGAFFVLGEGGEPSFLEVLVFFFLPAFDLGALGGFRFFLLSLDSGLAFFSLDSGLIGRSVGGFSSGSSSGFAGGRIELREGVVGVVSLGAVAVFGVGEAILSSGSLGPGATLSGVRGELLDSEVDPLWTEERDVMFAHQRKV